MAYGKTRIFEYPVQYMLKFSFLTPQAQNNPNVPEPEKKIIVVAATQGKNEICNRSWNLETIIYYCTN